jgi:hypothetical protein
LPLKPVRLLVVAADASLACLQIVQAAGTQRKNDQVLRATIGASSLSARDQQLPICFSFPDE